MKNTATFQDTVYGIANTVFLALLVGGMPVMELSATHPPRFGVAIPKGDQQ